jgi:hypothetical protein
MEKSEGYLTITKFIIIRSGYEEIITGEIVEKSLRHYVWCCIDESQYWTVQNYLNPLVDKAEYFPTISNLPSFDLLVEGETYFDVTINREWR